MCNCEAVVLHCEVVVRVLGHDLGGCVSPCGDSSLP